MKTRTLTRLAFLTAVALVLGYLEQFIPVTGIPGIKLGLANTVLLYAVFLLDIPSAIALMALKVVLGGLLYGGVSAMLYSLAGGVVSLGVMLAVSRIRGVSPVGVSVAGAVGHNLGQLTVAAVIVGARAALAYMPVLMLAAAVTGAVTGVAAKYAMSYLKGLEK